MFMALLREQKEERGRAKKGADPAQPRKKG